MKVGKWVLRSVDWEVRSIPFVMARDFTVAHHYAKGGSNTAVYTHGLFCKGVEDCCGITWWIPPTRKAAEATYPPNWGGVLNLSRLVIAPGVPTNAATFLLSRSRKLIDRKKWPCLVTYADTWRGHTGAIYRADNWDYMGMTAKTPCWVIGERMVAKKAGPHTRTNAEMLALGAVCLGSFSKHKFVKLT